MKESIIFLLTIIGLTFFTKDNIYENSEQNYKNGVIGAMIFVCIMGSLKSSNPFKSCNLIYRIQLWLAICYNAFLVFLIFQNEKDARQLMKLGDESLGVPVLKEMHTYDDNCELEWNNILDNFDHYYLSHVINWLLASFLVRDTYLLHLWSILDELIELSWQHKLPHFRECWWDHVFLDVLLSNTIAIHIGMFIIQKCGFLEYDWFGRKDLEYDWFGRKKCKSIREWGIWKDKRRFEAFIIILIVIIVNFLDGFFLMNSLWVPPKCWMVVYRLLIWFAMGHFAFRELYNWTLDKKYDEFQGRFLTYFTICIETWISIKFLKDSGNLQDENTPLYVSVPWILVIGLCIIHYIKI